MNKKIIAIVCPIKDQILRVQSVRALIESISSNQEFEVIVFSEFDHNDIVYAKSFISNSASYIILKKNCQPGMSRLFTALMHWRPIILKTNKSSPFECIIAVDKWGLLMLPLLGKLDVRVVYLNLELRIISETKRASRKIVNWIEGVLHRNINCTIIQDPWREKAIRLEHKLPETHPVMLLPNSPLGISINATSSSFKRNHGIPESDIVILYVGSIVDHFLVYELAQASSSIINLQLIIHSPPAANIASSLRERVRRLSQQFSNIHLHEEMLSPDELDLLIQGCDIGISLAKPMAGNEINEELLGYSSGKIASYLKNGLPIIVSNLSSLQWVYESGCGICLPIIDSSSLGAAANTIFDDRQNYAERARLFYNKNLNLDMYIPKIINYLQIGCVTT